MATSTDLRAAIEEIQADLPAPEGIRPEALGEEYQQGALKKLEERLGALPWWTISGSIHAMLLLLALVLGSAVVNKEPSQKIIFESDFTKPEPPKYDRQRRPALFTTPDQTRLPDIKAPSDVQTPMDFKTPDLETPNDAIERLTKGNNGVLFDIESPVTAFAIVGVGFGDPLGAPNAFGRPGPGGQKPGGKGGDRFTENAVDKALKWLARHQEDDGSWDPVKHEARNGDNIRYRVGCTGLALLAFLGHGETDRLGRYKDTVRRAEEWLLKQQKPNGGVFEKEGGGSNVAAGYNHAIAGLALAEAWGMSDPARRTEFDRRLGAAAQKAVDYSIQVHQSPYSGWRYDARESPDLSVTGWFVMQLKSARMAGLQADGSAFLGARKYLDKVTNQEGGAGYTSSGAATDSMTAVALLCRQFMGDSPTEPLLIKAAERLYKSPPDWATAKSAPHGSGAGDKGFYYWYYGTLAMFQAGNDKLWKGWNESMKNTLVKNQCVGGPTDRLADDKDGSWDPQSWIDIHGGRVFTTAMGALTLEVYYRYLFTGK